MTKVERVVYTKVYSTIKQDKNLNSSEKLLLCEIISFNDNGRCTASNGYLGDSLGMKKTAISNAIKELVKKGYIESNTFTEHQNTKRWLKPTAKTMILITDGILIEEPKEEITPELNEAACEEEKEVASLNAEEEYKPKIITEDEIEKSKFLQKNLNCIKAHIDELSAKEYQKLLKNKSLNYVIMFIPVESAYISALDCDRYIYDYAYKKNIILATPLSLLPTLRTIENLWRIDSQNQNVQKIAELGGKIYDKLASFVEDMKSIDRALNQATNAYNNAMTKLQGRGSALSQAEKMKQLGSKTSKTINLNINDNDLLLEDNTNITSNGEN